MRIRGPVGALVGLASASLAALWPARAAAQWLRPVSPGFDQVAVPFGPPMPVASPPSPASLRTMRELDAARAEDSGRKLEWVWIDARGGFEQLGMQTFKGGDGFVGNLVKTSSSGGNVSAALGARLLFLTLLLRGSIGVFDSGQLYRLGPEVGFHVPLGNVEPHVSVGAGYAAVGGLKDEVGGAAASLLALRGGYGRVGVGVDYFVAPVFSIGLAVSAELLGLVRPALTPDEVTVLTSKLPAGNASVTDLATSGSGIGGTLAVTAVAGLHF